MAGVTQASPVWLDKHRIANLTSIPMLEADGCEVSTETKGDLVVQTPAGENIVFKRDTGICRGVPHIDLRERMDGFALIETIEGNIDKFLENRGSDEEIKRAMLSRTIQKQIGCLPDEGFKKIVSMKSLKTCPVTVNDIVNATSILGLHNCNKLKEAAMRRRPNSMVGVKIGLKYPETGTN